VVHRPHVRQRGGQGHPFAFTSPAPNTAHGLFDLVLESVPSKREGRGDFLSPIRSKERHPVGYSTDAKSQEGAAVTVAAPPLIRKQVERWVTRPIEDGRVSTRPAD